MQKYKTQLHLPRLQKKKHVLLWSNVSEHVLRRWIEAEDGGVLYTLWLRKAIFFCTTQFVSALIKHEGTYEGAVCLSADRGGR